MKKNNVKFVQIPPELVENIGARLFEKLTWDQKIFMAKTAGVIEFANKIDIHSVYSYIESHES